MLLVQEAGERLREGLEERERVRERRGETVH